MPTFPSLNTVNRKTWFVCLDFFFLIPKNLSGERLEGNPARTQLHSSVCTNDFLPFSVSTACPAPATQSKRFLGLSATTSAPKQKVKHTFQRHPKAPKESDSQGTDKIRKPFQKMQLGLYVILRKKGIEKDFRPKCYKILMCDLKKKGLRYLTR